MGQQAECTVCLGNKTSKGKALLESESLVFRGDFRLAIPFREMESVRAADGELRIKFREGVARFSLGPQAQRWAHKILHPKSPIEKLGVKPASVLFILGVNDGNFRRQLGQRAGEIADGTPRKDSDFIFLGAEAADVNRLNSLTKFLKRSGAIWVTYPKGKTHITQADVMAAAKRAGLVDVKVVSFSATHTALKLVIPVRSR